jgi:uncharacterized repeat protein (TIGR03943 family)
VKKTIQNLLLMLIGVALLRITVISGEYLNYVRPAFRILLIATAVIMLLLGAVGIWIDARTPDQDEQDSRHDSNVNGGGHGYADGLADHDSHHHGPDHGHSHKAGAPRTAWLLFLPVLAIFLIAPPALGSFTASRATARSAPAAAPPSKGYAPLPDGSPVPMSISEYIGRAFAPHDGLPATLPGHRVVLTGFVMPSGQGRWYLARLHIACCAADAFAMQVSVRGAAMPPKDSWVQVTGAWTPPPKTNRTIVQPIAALAVSRIPKPHDPYE